MGIHRDRRLLHFSRETFSRWFGRRAKTAIADPPVRKVALFASCLVNFQATDVGKATVQVLENNGVQVVVRQRCCGMPSFDIGDTQAIQRLREAMWRHCIHGCVRATMLWSRPPVAA